MRVGSAVYYTLSDHIGSTSITLNNSGSKIAEMRYKAWGEVRYESGNLQTDRTYTGQRSYSDDFGLMFYNARWYDTSIGHFAQADNINIKVADTQSLDRFAYVSNNPIIRTDPTGHKQVCSTVWDNQQSQAVQKCHEEPDTVLDIQQKKVEDAAAWVHIRLPDSRYFVVVDGIVNTRSPDGITYGYAPRPTDPEGTMVDGNGNILGDPSAVYISSALFDLCNGGNNHCMGQVMAHEATHTWIQFKMEEQGTLQGASPAEEALADLIPLMHNRGRDFTGGALTAHLGNMNSGCYQSYGSSCSAVLQSWGTNLSGLITLVYEN